jgi:hypothetical protein
VRIAIDINGVLRNTIGKIEQVYQKNNIDGYQNEFGMAQTYSLDMSGNTEEERVDTPFTYEMSLPVTSLTLTNHFKFQSEEEYYSFLYEEHPMEIFGHAQSTEYSTFNDLNEIYIRLRNDYDFIIVSDEIGKSKPASLFFLSKFGCEFEKVKFYSNITINSMWDEIDILLTANPTLLLEHPSDKVLIKYNTDYNSEIKTKYEINKIKEIEGIIKQLKLC